MPKGIYIGIGRDVTLRGSENAKRQWNYEGMVNDRDRTKLIWPRKLAEVSKPCMRVLGAITQERPAGSDRSRDLRMFGILAGCAYLLRDSFAALWRWLLDLAGLPFLWFAVDLLGIAALAAFAWQFGLRERAPFAIYALAILPISLFIAAATVESDPAFLFSAGKMILPLYAGWLLAGLDLAALPRARKILLFACIATIFGVWLDQFVTFPWMGLSVDQFGVTKTVDKIWWIRSVTRFSGFAGESTGAAAVALFTFLIVHRQLRPAAALALGLGVMMACLVATSRTAFAVAGVATACIAAQGLLIAQMRSHAAHRLAAVSSFAAVLVPLALVAAASTIRFEEVTPALASFEQRIHASWQYPFTLLADRSPASLIFGCGLGCLTFPANYSGWANLLQPIDNFYIVSLAMFGLFFLPVALGMVLAAMREKNRTKLMLILAINLYTLSIEAFSPAFTLFTIGYATSGMHLFGLVRRREAALGRPLSQSA